MNNSQLRKLGVPDALIADTLAGIRSAADAKALRGYKLKKYLPALLADPAAHAADPHFGPLAKAVMTAEAADLAPPREPIPYRTWGADIDAEAHKQMRDACALPQAVGAALMPDAHVGYGLPIGGVLALENAVVPYAVGVDIACRMKLSVLDTPVGYLDAVPEKLESALQKGTRFGVGSRFQKRQEHPVMDADWHVTKITREQKDKAWAQLGSSGSGNHFAEFGLLTLEEADEELGLAKGEYLALLSHSGSRGVGAAVCSTYSAIARNRLGKRQQERFGRLAWLDMDSQEGREYWAAMNLMGDYAAANHAVLHRNVLGEIGAQAIAGVENHHNFCIPAGERIPTPAGPRFITEISPGDEVYGFDREGGLAPVTVTARWESGRKPCLTVRTAHRRLRLSAEHPVLVVRADRVRDPALRGRPARAVGRYEWVPAGELRKGDEVVCGEGYYPRAAAGDEGVARFLGAFLGDGWTRREAAVTRQGYGFGLAIGTGDQPHTARYRRLMERLPLPVLAKGTWKSKAPALKVDAPGAFGISGSGREVWEFVRGYGLHRPSKARRVPAEAFGYGLAAKRALLAGYMDADGSVGPHDGSGLVRSTNPALVADLRELAIGAGLTVSPVRATRQVTNFGPAEVHGFNVSPGSLAELDLWHEAKAANVRTAGRVLRPARAGLRTGRLDLPPGTFVERILSVAPGGEPEPVFDLTVDAPEHAFVCEGVVVHNCWKETHGGREVYVHRKGATPAGAGVLGVIPGSMADPAFVVRGKGRAESLDSASHGAGRRMSRTKAKAKYAFGSVKKTLAARGVRVISAGADEVPGVYKNIRQVMADQTDLVEVVARFDPKVVKMCGDGSRAED